LLFRAVGIEAIRAEDWHTNGPDLGFSVPSVRQSSLRALNFNPRFSALLQKLKSVRHKELGELCVPRTLRRGDRYKRIDADKEFGVELIGQKQLFWLRSEGRFLARKALPADASVEEGCILVAARGTLGENELFCRAEFVWGQMTTKAYSEDLLKILADEREVDRGYLFAFARSETMFRMLRSISTGTKLQDHHPRLLASLPIPFADDATREVIHRWVIEGSSAKDRALTLENEAVATVEGAIGGGH
jgi:type I restriction enzyme S subunit